MSDDKLTDEQRQKIIMDLFQAQGIMLHRAQSAFDAMDEQNVVVVVNCLNRLEEMLLKSGNALGYFLDEKETKESWEKVSEYLNQKVDGFQIRTHRLFKLSED